MGPCQGLGVGLGDCPPPQVGGSPPYQTCCLLFSAWWAQVFPCPPPPAVGVGDMASGRLGCLPIRWDSVSLCLREQGAGDPGGTVSGKLSS